MRRFKLIDSYIYLMDLEKKDPKILKDVIFEIARYNGAELSRIVKTPAKRRMVEFLKELGMVDFDRKKVQHKKGSEDIERINLKNNMDTLKKIGTLLDNKELAKFMRTKHYKINRKVYIAELANLFNENKLLPVPGSDYLDYSLTNSPASFRFFLVDNDINSLKEFYDRSISLARKNADSRTKLEMLEKYNMYLIWDNVIFEMIQEDLKNEILMDPANYFAGYLPIAKRKLENLINFNESKAKEEADSSGIKKVFESLKEATKPLRRMAGEK